MNTKTNGIRFLKYLFFIISFFLFERGISFAQNLVPNPSFEDTVSCPTNVGQISKAVGWSSYRNSPDYFSTCNSSTVGVPSNIYDYQYARTGNSYAGFYSYSPNAREFIGTQLNQTLLIGQKYFVSLYVSRPVNNILGLNIAINKIGIRFSTVSYSASVITVE